MSSFHERDREPHNLVFTLSPGTGPGPVVLTTKLHIPRPARKLVARPRLLARLQEALQHPLTLVCAPAGYGKTMLLAEWAATAPCPMAWVSLDPGDNDPVRFWTYVVAALQTLKSDIGGQALLFLQSVGASQQEAFVSTLLNELCLAADHWTLVLEDYHLIASEELHRGVAFLIDHLPERMHVVIASRTVPPLPLARLSVRDQLVEIGKEGLCFTREEETEFFKQAQVFNLTERELDLLHTKTEGWVAALQLVALSIREQADAASYIASLTGSQHRIAEYLVEEVVSQQPPYVQEFLLKTSILDRLCAPLCDALLGDDYQHSHEMLAHLQRANLFLVTLDADHVWYRYHHLFAELLRSRLQQTYPDLVLDLYRRASVWYEQQGQPALAIETALSGKDWERAAHLIETHYQAMVMRAQWSTLSAWLDGLPPDLIRSRPNLSFARAWTLMWTKEGLDGLEACVLDAERGLELQGGHGDDPDVSHSALGATAMLRAALAVNRNEPESVIRFSQRALELLPETNRFLRRAAHACLGMAYVRTGDPKAARYHLSEAARCQEAIPDIVNSIHEYQQLTELEMLEGNLRAAAQVCREALKLTRLPDGKYMHVAAVPLIEFAALCYEWNDLEAALGYLTDGLELIKNWWSRNMLIQALGLDALIKQANGDGNGALASLLQAETALRPNYLTDLMRHVAADQIRYWRREGHLKTVTLLIESLQHTLQRDAGNNPIHQEDVLAIARWLVAENNFETAGKWLGPLVESAERGGFQRRLIEALVLQALAFWGIGNKRQALFALQRALELAQSERYVRVFVDEGAPMRALLEQAARANVMPAYTAELLAVPGSAEPALPGAAPVMVEPLSERELEILRLLAAGKSPREVASVLVISIDTVRNHIKSVYSKLQAHTRLQAVQRARELHLL